MFFILDVDVNELNHSKENIIKLFGSEINFNNLNYELRSIICFKNRNHFSTFIRKLDSPYIALFENQFDKDLHYYMMEEWIMVLLNLLIQWISYIVKFIPIHIHSFITKKSKIIFIYCL